MHSFAPARAIRSVLFDDVDVVAFPFLCIAGRFQHSTEQDCWLVIGNDGNGERFWCNPCSSFLPFDLFRFSLLGNHRRLGGPKVYDITKYLNDHPGGPEIMMEFAGKDADEMFEDIGHSNEARKTMEKYLIGTLKVDPNAPKKSRKVGNASDIKSKGGLNPVALVILLIAIAAGVYFSQMKK